MRPFTKISFAEAGEKGVNLGYKKYDNEGLVGVTSKEYKKVPHDDFKSAMNKLVNHTLFLTEFLDEGKFSAVPSEAAAGYRVTGVSFSGEDDKAGFIITGYKTLKSGKGFAFNTPLIKENNEDYVFMEELLKDLQDLKTAAEDYLGGKYGVKKQLELVLPEEGEPAPQN